MPTWTTGSEALRAEWGLDPAVDYLNHGSFGATPRSVLAVQTALREEMERGPVQFLARELPARLDAVRARLAAFLDADASGLVLVPNATHGVQGALDAIAWQPGDEVVHCDHGYGAVKQALCRLNHRYDVRQVQAIVPFPIERPEQVVEAFAAAIGPRTKLVIVDHITSATALVLPAAELVALCRARGVPVLVDGAHAPGLLPLSIAQLDPDFYTGNLHKWVCAPKGAAVLWVHPSWRERAHPAVTSHGYGLGPAAEFEWTGTFDPTAWLAVPAAIDKLEGFGLAAMRASNHGLAQEGRERLAHALGTRLPHPDNPAWYGPMAAVQVPWARGEDGPALTARLHAEHRIEVPFTRYDSRCFVRISAQLYNHAGQYQRLADILRTWR
jgi:isopenicillin-N epimerase